MSAMPADDTTSPKSAGEAAHVAEHRWALVIGVNKTASSLFAPLRNAEQDALNIAAILQEQACGFRLWQSPLVGEQATSDAIKRAIRAFGKERSEEDFLLLYFSGHGFVRPGEADEQMVYLGSADFVEGDPEEEAESYISLKWLRRWLYEKTDAKRVLLILDCCFAGEMGRMAPDHYLKDLRDRIRFYFEGPGASSDARWGGLRQALTATGHLTVASDEDGQKRMAEHLLPALQGKIDKVIEADGTISLQWLHRYLQQQMPEQQPSLSGDFANCSCILASYPHRSEYFRQREKEKEMKNEVERGILGELFRLHAETQHAQPFDHSICYNASIDDLDWGKISEFLKRERTQQDEVFQPGISAQEQLIHFGFLQKTLPTYGTLLCFGRSPIKWVSGAITRCIEWGNSSDHNHIQDSREYKGCLLKQFELTLNFLRKCLRLHRNISTEGSIEEWEIPFRVLEEAVANALVHREYTNRTDPIRIEVFDNRIEISSPGTLPSPMTEELLRVKHKSYPRNPQIAGIFYFHNYVEKLGNGIERMQNYMKAAYLPEPEFKSHSDNTFTVVLYRPKRVPEIRTSLKVPEEQEIGETQQERRRIEKDERLRIALTDHSAFLQNRLASFVGRTDELKDLGQRIQQLLPTGGYLTITGQAGQGKSSIIAKLVEQRGVDQTAFHFIPLNPGPEHQVGLLRNLLARLILKYNLSDLYLASESRTALHEALLALLKEVAAKGGQEVIFIDGLDQLEEEQTGVRDLSFLPTNPPPGIVLVLGTRPNDALRPLELLKPHVTYPLPNLSRHDFDLILEHRQVPLSSVLADRFYEAMQQNALYLNLVAKELAEHDQQPPEELIQQLTENPERLFSLATDRFKRQWWLWRDLIKPILGLLLVVQEPLSKRHMRNILDVDADSLNKGLEHLGGLMIRDEQDHYSLYHSKFREFLQEDPSRPQKQFIFAQDEVEGWHLRVARWCEQSDIMNIWKDVPNDVSEQGRRLYARQHYITHLYYARQWQTLFAILDAGTFGHAKLEHDPSMRSYTLDLSWGERAAAWENYSLEQGIDYLPVLWHYSLLRCRLVSRADSYPDEAFETMILLGQSVKAVGIAELLTDPVRKVRVLLLLARQLVKRRGQHQEAAQLVKRAMVVASLIERALDKDEALSSLASSLAQMQRWQEAKRVIASIQESTRQAEALSPLASSLAQGGEGETAKRTWQEAKRVIASTQESETQVWALSSLASSLAQRQQWQEAERVIASIQESGTQAEALSSLASSLAQGGEGETAKRTWQEAERVIASIQNSDRQARALSTLASSLAQGGAREAAQRTWHEAERVIASIEDSRTQAEALSSLASSLAQGQQWHEAERVIASIEDSRTQAQALSSLASSLAQAHEWEMLLRIIQRFWKSAKTYEGALALFSLALNFFSTTPLLGKRLHEAFVWVDTFLRS